MYYLLDENNNPYRVALLSWASASCGSRHVRDTTIKKYNVRISTVFLGLDHNWGHPDNTPILFETMIFTCCDLDQKYMERYCTYQQALEGHRRAVRMVIKSIRTGEPYES